MFDASYRGFGDFELQSPKNFLGRYTFPQSAMFLSVFMAQEYLERRGIIRTVCSRPEILGSSKALLRAKGETVVMVSQRACR